jgi:hypothetical protein
MGGVGGGGGGRIEVDVDTFCCFTGTAYFRRDSPRNFFGEFFACRPPNVLRKGAAQRALVHCWATSPWAAERCLMRVKLVPGSLRCEL